MCHNARITMNGRLRGGMNNSVPGAWFWPTCNQGVCWPARRSCCRCGQPRSLCPSLPLVRRAGNKRSFREEQFLGRQQQTTPSGCPTTRVGRGIFALNTDRLRQLALSSDVIEQLLRERIVLDLANKQLQGALQKLEKRLQEHLQAAQARVTEEHEEALRASDADNQARRPRQHRRKKRLVKTCWT